MLLFRLAWVTSWLSLLLASSQSLLSLSDYRSTSFAKPLLPLSPSGEKPDLSAFTFSLAAPTKSSSLLSFQPSLIGSAPPSTPQNGKQAFKQNSLQNRSCQSTAESKDIAPEILSTFSVEVSQEQGKDLNLPQKVGRVVKGLFGWSKLMSPPSKTQSSRHLVTVTSSARRQGPQAEFVKQSFGWLNSSSQPEGKTTRVSDRMPFQVWVNGQEIARFPQQHQAEVIAQSLKNELSKPDFEPLQLKPALANEKPAIVMGDRVLLVVEQALVAKQTVNRELLAIQWTNRLRAALNVPPLDLAKAQEEMYGLVETRSQFQGLASWYGGYFHGRMTANGEIFNQHAFTAAHPSLPFDTYLKVTNLKTDESAIVRINDRGPYIPPRTLDLSLGVAQCIQSEQTGVVPYNATIMKQDVPVDSI